MRDIACKSELFIFPAATGGGQAIERISFDSLTIERIASDELLLIQVRAVAPTVSAAWLTCQRLDLVDARPCMQGRAFPVSCRYVGGAGH